MKEIGAPESARCAPGPSKARHVLTLYTGSQHRKKSKTITSSIRTTRFLANSLAWLGRGPGTGPGVGVVSVVISSRERGSCTEQPSLSSPARLVTGRQPPFWWTGPEHRARRCNQSRRQTTLKQQPSLCSMPLPHSFHHGLPPFYNSFRSTQVSSYPLLKPCPSCFSPTWCCPTRQAPLVSGPALGLAVIFAIKVES